MNKPTDYPLRPERAKENNNTVVSEEMTYADILERVDAQQPITDDMIRAATVKMDTAHSRSKKEPSGASAKLNKLVDRFRPLSR